jgi:hypothetical protein
MFERLYLASVAIGLVNAVLNIATAERLLAANPATQGLGGGFVLAMIALSAAISLTLWYFTARRASNLAKWLIVILAVWTATSVVLGIADRSTGFADSVIGPLVALGLELVAIFFLFQPDARRWFDNGAERRSL